MASSKYKAKAKGARKKVLVRKEADKRKRKALAAMLKAEAKRAREPKRRAAAKKAKPKKRASARKKTAKPKKLSAAALKKRRSEAAKKAAVTRKKNAEAKKRAAAKKAKQAKKRATKNAKIRKRVTAREKLRQKGRRKRITPKARRQTKAEVAAEKKAIELQRLFDEKMRQIEEEKAKQKESKGRILSQLSKRFNTLLSEAKRTKQLPKVPRERTIRSHRLRGTKRHVGIGMILTPELVADIMHKVTRVSHKMPLVRGAGWLATIMFAGLGESLLGYGQVILSSSMPGASMFQVQGIESSGGCNTREGMLMKLEEKLEGLADERSTTVYVNFITLSTFVRL